MHVCVTSNYFKSSCVSPYKVGNHQRSVLIYIKANFIFVEEYHFQQSKSFKCIVLTNTLIVTLHCIHCSIVINNKVVMNTLL